MTAFIFHEIRNPLNAMLGAIQMIATTVQTARERKWAQIAINTMGMVSNVLNDVLFLSKIEAGKVILHKSPFSVAEMLEETAFMFSEQAKQKGISLMCHCANETHQLVIGDEGRLKEALANFCSNAIKFTDGNSGEGATVTLMADQVCDHANEIELNIHVTDTGRGLSSEEKAKLFVPFQTLRDEREEQQSNHTKGTGLGLVISKHIILAHGGEVYVDSKGEGKGSRFGFRICLEKATGAQEQMRSPRWSEDRASNGQASSTESTEDISVLLVDDDEFNLEVVQDMLLSLGWKCQTATNGTQALRQLGIASDDEDRGPDRRAAPSCAYSCIVTDNIMPVLNGRELTRRCRQELAETCPPIIGLTGSAQLDDLRACKDAGMDTVLTKPVRLADLAAAVRSAVAIAHNSQAKKSRGVAAGSYDKAAQQLDGPRLGRRQGSLDGSDFDGERTDNSLAAAANALDVLGLDDLEDMLMDHEAAAAAANDSPDKAAGVGAVATGRSFPSIPGLQIEGLMRPRQASHLSGGSSGSDGASSTRECTPSSTRPTRGMPWSGENGPSRPALGPRSTLTGPTPSDNPLHGARRGSWDELRVDSVNYVPSPHHDL
jgi:CheY-like chemotaxis protein